MAEAAVPIHECDLSSVMLTLTRTGAPTRFLIFSDPDKAGGDMRIDVLAHPRKEIKGTKPEDTTQLSLSVSKYASCSATKHPLLTVTPGGGDGVECKAVSGVLAKHDTPLYRPLRTWEGDWASSGDTFQIWQLIQWFWAAFSDSHMGQVDVDVATCGIRKAGKIVGGAKLAIHIYPIESYSVALSLPPLWSRKKTKSNQYKKEYGTDPFDPKLIAIDKQRDHDVSTVTEEDKFFFSPKSSVSKSTTTQTQEHFGEDVTVSKTSTNITSGGTTLTGEHMSVDGQKGGRELKSGPDLLKPWERWGVKLAIKRNGSNLDFEAGKFLSTVTRMMDAYELFRKGMTTAVKGDFSAGLTLSGEFNVLVVDLTAMWQRKEDAAQSRVPWNLSVTLTGKLIDSTLSAVYGLVVKYTCHTIEVMNFEGTVTVSFNGNVPVSLSKTAIVYGDQWTWFGKDHDWTSTAAEVAIKAPLTVTASGKCTAKVMGRGAEVVVTGTAGVLVDSKFYPGSAGSPPCLKGNIMFTGLSLTVSTLIYTGETYQSKPIVLINPAPIIKEFVVGHG